MLTWVLLLVWVGFWGYQFVVVVVEAFFQHCCSTKTISCGIENQFYDEVSGYKSLNP